jgi:hypothetical protein
LRRRIDEDISRLMSIAVIGQLEQLIPDAQRVLVPKCNGRQGRFGSAARFSSRRVSSWATITGLPPSPLVPPIWSM